MNTTEYLKHCKQVGAEGCVLLENDGVLPLIKTDKVAVFGREQFEYIKSGSGSGGCVQCEYVTDINTCLQGKIIFDEEVESFYKEFIKANPRDVGDGWAIPPVQKQPILSESFVKSAAARCDKALIVISRIFGEGIDMHVKKGEYLLTDEEENALELITKHFKRVAVVVNSGNLIDLRWIKKYNIGGLMLVWQGGQEGGAAAAAALTGEIPPSGKMPSSAADIAAYDAIPFGDQIRNFHEEDIYVGYRYLLTFCPEKIIYPFGYGLTYTTFDIKTTAFSAENGKISVSVSVKNTGERSSKQVVEIYFSAPQGKLGKPAKELLAFKKTRELAPGEEQSLNFEIDATKMNSFDDKNACGFGRAFVLESGDYNIYAGTDCVNCKPVGTYVQNGDLCVLKTSDALHPRIGFNRITPSGNEHVAAYDCALPETNATEIKYVGDKGLTLQNVAAGVCTMDEFMAQLPPEQLACLVRGEGWGSSKASVAGSASVMGGVTDFLKEHGVPIATLCDGPSGPRTTDGTTFVCVPSGMLIASTWDVDVIKNMFYGFAEELVAGEIDVILAPGINVHRHPCGGRNFEYFSEDPLLAGSFASAICKYFYDKGILATPKHFAVNSQETQRGGEDEVLSERALREIFLKPFEIAVRDKNVHCIMTSYNRINGTSACANVWLTDAILRREWGYDGLVMTDWWARADNHEDGSFSIKNVAQMVKAQNDVFMVVTDAIASDDNVLSELNNGKLTLAELQRSAKHMLECVMKTLAFKDFGKRTVNTDEVMYTIPVENNAFKSSCEGKINAEAVYSTKGDGLEQFSVSVCLDGVKQAAFTVQQTGGAQKTARFSISVPSHHVLISFSDNVTVYTVRIFRS